MPKAADTAAPKKAAAKRAAAQKVAPTRAPTRSPARTAAPTKAAAKTTAAKKTAAKKTAAKKTAAKRTAAQRPALRHVAAAASASTRPAAEEAPAAAPAKRMSAWLELPLLLLVAIVVTLIVKALLAQAFYIPSGSMEPQLHVNDRVLVSRTSYELHDPNRGDIIVFPSPIAVPDPHGFVDGLFDEVLDGLAVGDRGDEELIKRVVGLPGETIEARDGAVLIDGGLLTEPYLPNGVTTFDFGPIEIPEGRVFVMGDNRGNSHDSRFADIGTIDVDDILGRAIARIWPPGRTAFL